MTKNFRKPFIKVVLALFFLVNAVWAYAQCVGETTFIAEIPRYGPCSSNPGSDLQWVNPPAGVGGNGPPSSDYVTWTKAGTFTLYRTYPCGIPPIYHTYTVQAIPSSPTLGELSQDHLIGQVTLRGGTNTYWQTYAGGTDTGFQSTKTVTQIGTSYARNRSGSCWSGATAVAVNEMPGAPSEPTTAEYHCVGSSTFLYYLYSPVGCATGGTIVFDGGVGGAIDQANLKVNWTSTGTFRLKRTYPACGSASVIVKYTPYYTVGLPPAGPNAANLVQTPESGQVKLSYTGAGTVYWHTQPDGDSGNPNIMYVQQPGTYYAKFRTGQCWSSPTEVVVTSIPAPLPGLPGPTYCVGTTVLVDGLPSSFMCGTGGPIQWEQTPPAGSSIDQSTGRVTWGGPGTFRFYRFYGDCVPQKTLYSPYYTVSAQPAAPSLSELSREYSIGTVALAYTGSYAHMYWVNGPSEVTGSRTTATVSSPANRYARFQYGDHCWSASTTIQVNEIPEQPWEPVGNSNHCVGSTSTIKLLPLDAGCGNGGPIQWDGSVGGTIDQQSGTVLWTTTGTFRFKRSYPSGCSNAPTLRYSPYYTVAPQPSTPNPALVELTEGDGYVDILYTGPENVFWQVEENGTDIFSGRKKTVVEPGTYYGRLKPGYECWGGAIAVTVNSVPPPLPTPSGPENCVGNTIQISGLPKNMSCGDGEDIQFDGPGEGGVIDQTSGSVTWTVPGTYRFRRFFPNENGCSYAPTGFYLYSPYYTVAPQPSGPSSGEIIQQPGCEQVTLSYTGSYYNTYWQTYQNGMSGVNRITKTVTETGNYYVRFHIGLNCWSTATLSPVSYIPVRPLPIVPLVDVECSPDGTSVTLTTDNVQDRWYVSQASTTPLGPTNSYTTTIVPTSTVYIERQASCPVRVPHAIDYTYSLRCGEYLNSIVTIKPLVPVASIISTTPQNQTVVYFDGLGRDIQNIAVKGSPLEKDIVQPKVYDLNGREFRNYLPFVADEATGTFKNVGFTSTGNYTHNFYNNASDNIVDDAYPFAEMVYEPSPLSRVLKQGAPGAAWQPSPNNNSLDDHTVKKRYGFNELNAVIKFTYDHNSGVVTADAGGGIAYYDQNELFANTTFDEENNVSIEFVDKEGRTICKKVQHAGDVNNPSFASTYYIYDAFGQLVIVLPPEAVNSAINELTQN